MQFDESVEYLLSLGHETLTIKLGLRNTELLLRELQNPERSFPAVQIAGTNGKGSTAAFLDSICRRAGIKSGLYTSPHLQRITERIKVAGVEVSQDDFARYSTTVRNAAHQLVTGGQMTALPTFFEQVTAIALVAFSDANVELAILETGLGGRLDSTTAVNADVCGITQIALDHEEYLGSDLRSIAAEKAAIIRPGSKVVVAPQRPEAFEVITNRCEEVGVNPVVDGYTTTINGVSPDGRFTVTFETAHGSYQNVSLGLRGRHQIENAGIAIQLAGLLNEKGFKIGPPAVIAGLQTATHPGRLEFFAGSPSYLLDGAHNPAGAQALREFLESYAIRPLTIVFGSMKDKNLNEIGKIIFPIADDLILTSTNNPRTASTKTLLEVAGKFARGSVTVADTSKTALEIAAERTRTTGMICVTGSLYLIGEVRERIADQER